MGHGALKLSRSFIEPQNYVGSGIQGLDSSTAKMSVKFQSDTNIITSNLAASSLKWILP